MKRTKASTCRENLIFLCEHQFFVRKSTTTTPFQCAQNEENASFFYNSLHTMIIFSFSQGAWDSQCESSAHARSVLVLALKYDFLRCCCVALSVKNDAIFECHIHYYAHRDAFSSEWLYLDSYSNVSHIVIYCCKVFCVSIQILSFWSEHFILQISKCSFSNK